MNVPGDYVEDPDQIKQYLIDQVTESVRWYEGIFNMSSHVDYFLEIGPSKTLTALNKKIGIKNHTFSFEKTEDLDRLGERFTEIQKGTYA